MTRPVPPSPSLSPSRSWIQRRVSAIDAARGAAMMLVCLSHFGAAYLREEQPVEIQLLLGVTMLATPSFLFISGMTLGLLYDRSRAEFAPTRLTLIDWSLRLPHSPLWPLYFVLSLVPLAAAARWWDNRQGNRYLTIGSAAIGNWLFQRAE